MSRVYPVRLCRLVRIHEPFDIIHIHTVGRECLPDTCFQVFPRHARHNIRIIVVLKDAESGKDVLLIRITCRLKGNKGKTKSRRPDDNKKRDEEEEVCVSGLSKIDQIWKFWLGFLSRLQYLLNL